MLAVAVAGGALPPVPTVLVTGVYRGNARAHVGPPTGTARERHIRGGCGRPGPLRQRGQGPSHPGANVATHSTWWVIGKRSNARSAVSTYPSPAKVRTSRASPAGSQAT